MLGIKKIISGGQTGVDQAALDFAIHVGFDHGGFCPKGKICEDGIIPSKYNLTELESTLYQDRTEKNVLASDGTLIIKDTEAFHEGSKLTIDFCKKHSKPFLIVDINYKLIKSKKEILNWIKINKISILNIAGNRESQSPGIQKNAFIFLKDLLGAL